MSYPTELTDIERRLRDIRAVRVVTIDRPDGTGTDAMRRVAEADRAMVKDLTDRGWLTWRHLLAARMHAAFAASGPDALRAALLDAAAVTLDWIEAIDRRSNATESDTPGESR
ncbi:hypothetical protein [Actinomadura miaoliensis]|uniref:Uncharacterized protein n=1 Tax=Actinomadura miaoliensis TaxID=430685 RepID=A0ABP7WBR6_9ACTN